MEIYVSLYNWRECGVHREVTRLLYLNGCKENPSQLSAKENRLGSSSCTNIEDSSFRLNGSFRLKAF